MEIVEGMVVKSVAGRDSNSFYIVFKIKENFVFIANGGRRKISKLKAKNFKHVRKTNTIVNLENFKTDKSVRTFLNSFNSKSI